MKIDRIKSTLKYLDSLAREYKEKTPKHIEDEVNQLKTRLENRLPLDKYDKQFLIRERETKRDFFKQAIFWSVKLFNEIDDSVGVSNIEYINQNKVDVVLKELSVREADLLGLAWDLLFKIEEPKEPLKEIVNYANNLPNKRSKGTYSRGPG